MEPVAAWDVGEIGDMVSNGSTEFPTPQIQPTIDDIGLFMTGRPFV